MPASCGPCDPEELWQDNIPGWNTALQYTGLLRRDQTGRHWVDHHSVRQLALDYGHPDPLELVEQLEAVARGFNAGLKGKHRGK